MLEFYQEILKNIPDIISQNAEKKKSGLKPDFKTQDELIRKNKNDIIGKPARDTDVVIGDKENPTPNFYNEHFNIFVKQLAHYIINKKCSAACISSEITKKMIGNGVRLVRIDKHNIVTDVESSKELRNKVRISINNKNYFNRGKNGRRHQKNNKIPPLTLELHTEDDQNVFNYFLTDREEVVQTEGSCKFGINNQNFSYVEKISDQIQQCFCLSFP